MARKIKRVRITQDGRDKGKHFLLTEMAASQAETWATRVLMGMAKSGVDLPAGIENMGMAGFAAVGMRAVMSMSFDDAGPLLAEMMACVQFDPGSNIPPRALIEDDIEEVKTRLFLRSEVIELHTGFSIAARLQTPEAAKET